jgi:hypothetical protein
MMARKTKKSEDQKLAEEIGAAFSDPKQAKPARKNARAPKSKAGPVSGELTARERERSLWAPRVSKAPKKKK